MVSKMQATRDFEAIRLAHDQFLSSLGSHCFFHLKPVCHSSVHRCSLFTLLDIYKRYFSGHPGNLIPALSNEDHPAIEILEQVQ